MTLALTPHLLLLISAAILAGLAALGVGNNPRVNLLAAAVCLFIVAFIF